MFQLTREELENLRSQIVTSNEGHGGRRYLPYALPEHGVAMLSSILNSERAVQMNIVIIRAFLKLRALLATHKELADRIQEIEATQRDHSSLIMAVVKEIKTLKQGPRPARSPASGSIRKFEVDWPRQATKTDDLSYTAIARGHCRLP